MEVVNLHPLAFLAPRTSNRTIPCLRWAALARSGDQPRQEFGAGAVRAVIAACACHMGACRRKRRGCYTGRRAAQETTKLGFFSDEGFKKLRDQFVASIEDDELELCEAYTPDLQANSRAAGGKSVYLFKLNHLMEVIGAAGSGEYVVYSDVDVQFLDKVLPDLVETMQNTDMCFQREFDDIGVNIGFMAIRRSSAVMNFWQEVYEIVSRTGGFDQRIVNDILYSRPEQELGLRWQRFPTTIWASSQALDGPPPEGVLVHHANWVPQGEFTLESRGPAKLTQLATLRQLVAANNTDGQRRLAHDLAHDGSLAIYKDRFYGLQRYGPEWTNLPAHHPTRPARERPKTRRRRATAG
mmetsp:Transcript_69041/g.128969  ORF Transcript_69041/g.128969 Transcript_69041/m.128969 type:complete len:354 (-) Transcript_69041:16-1077(-)